MIIVICYILLEQFTNGWSGWLFVFPALLDLAVVGKVLKDDQ